MIEAFSEADLKGLDPDDYEASLWPGRLGGLRTKPSDAAFATFDRVLTADATRYASDLHHGRVNPGSTHFDFDPNRLANSRDVVGELNAIEPPFPGYWRTQIALQNYLKLASEGDLPTVIPAQAPVKTQERESEFGTPRRTAEEARRSACRGHGR